MVRVTECFECGATEDESPLIFSKDGPVLCKRCNEKKSKN